MKRVKVSLLVMSITCCWYLSAQDRIAIAFSALQPVSLPYYGIKNDRPLEPMRNYHFPVNLWKDRLNVNLWKDLNLTIPMVLNSDFFFDPSDIYRRLAPSNGDYHLGIIQLGAGDDSKKMLVTATSSGAYIDALEINVLGGYWVDGLQSANVTVKQFKISADMQVTVYRLKPTSTTPIMFGSNTEVLTEIHAQRIDEIYQIDTAGRFVKTGKIKYQPKYYPLSTFYDNEINFWDGDEVPECKEE